MLLVKLDAFGNEIWARSYGGPSKEEVTDMVTDINGNSYLTGFYKSDSLNFYNVSKIDTTHYGHFFIAQINNNGNTQWINRGVQDTTYRYYNWGRHLALDKFERPYVIMEASQYPNMGGWGYALAKYDLTGKMYFNKFAWIGLTIQVAGLQVDDDLNIYTVMAAGTHADQGDLYKYDSSLTSTKWTYWLGPQYGCFGFYDPRVKPNGECFLTGRLGNPDDQVANCYNQAADSVGVPFGVLPLKGLYDVAVAKLTNNGKLAWYASAGGAGVDDAVSSHIDGSGNFYLSGVYNYTNQYFGTLNNTTQFSNWTLYPDGPWQQSFLAKLGDNNPVGMKEINAGTAIRLFPNPCKDQFVIDSEEGSGHFRIYNELGVLVLEDDFARGKSIDVRRFPAGLYIVDIADNSRRSVRKIVIE